MTEVINTQCCIAGGGPAGMMLGVLLARAGVDVVVLEKHADFLRDFRGDTVHPSTLEIIYELGWLEDFLKCPHQKVNHMEGVIGKENITLADFSHLKTQAPYIAFMPQWDFLNFLKQKASTYKNFTLIMQAKVDELLVANDTIVGVKATTDDGVIEVRSSLVVAADGRNSDVRRLAHMDVLEHGSPIDVLWFRISRKLDDPSAVFGRIMPGSLMVMLNRGDYWQCGYVIKKGEYEALKSQGLESFRKKILENAPSLKESIHEIMDWEQIKLLTVKVDFLKKWYKDGLLCIGDAAHAMSPVGGVGINLAIQDAVAAANILACPLAADKLNAVHVAAVQERRQWPTKIIQFMQLIMHKRIIYQALQSKKDFKAPLFLRAIAAMPVLQQLMGQFIGMGFRPEHINICNK
ncbi:MAG: FAD-dependent oxidoreductase [Alphaproteobacteria bacterium]|nr:FAD-dependent oxidoreductase [Alphaproteobacteria bacterium]